MNDATQFVMDLLTLVLTADQWTQLAETRVELADQIEEFAAYAAQHCDPDETIMRAADFTTLAELLFPRSVPAPQVRPAGA